MEKMSNTFSLEYTKRFRLEYTKRWIQWVLELIQSDLSSLSRSRFRGRCVEALYFSSCYFHEATLEEILLSDPFDKLPEVKIDDINETVLKNLRNKDYEENSPNKLEEVISTFSMKLPNLQMVLKDFLQKTQAVLTNPRPQDCSLPGRNQGLCSRVYLPETENYLQPSSRINSQEISWTWFTVPKEDDEKNWAILNFARLIEDVTTGAIKKCGGCGRFFLNASDRKKVYCSFACASRSVAHKRYEELKKDPKKYEAHLKKYRKLSSERYKKLRQMQYGPNVKIQRRKNNKKEG